MDMAFICKRCGHSSSTKGNLIQHLHSKKQCIARNEDISREELIKELQTREYKTETTICASCKKILSKSQIARHRKICSKHVSEARIDHIIPTQVLEEQEKQISIEDKKRKTKSKITHAMRIVCWNTYIGEEVGKTKCLCCKTNSITQHNFHCGHVIAEANGGKVNVANLRPICAICNNSMGTTDMINFAKESFNIEIS